VRLLVMIRINLLPIRAARKREYIKQQLILGVVMLMATIVGLFIWYSGMNSSIAQEKAKIAKTRNEIEKIKKTIGQVDKYKALEADLNRKLEIIESLIRGKTGPVEVMDRLSLIIPKQVWLTSWEEKGGLVIFQGEALSNKHIAEFITALKTRGARPKLDSAAGTGETETESGVESAKLPTEEQKKTSTPPGKKLLLSDVQLLESKKEEAKEYQQVFFEFKISVRVNYSI